MLMIVEMRQAGLRSRIVVAAQRGDLLVKAVAVGVPGVPGVFERQPGGVRHAHVEKDC